MTGNPGATYKYPPVIEVICGLVFEPITGLKLPYYGLFWDEFRAEYPVCQHASPLGFSPSVIDENTRVPLPRIWFLSKPENTLIQLQTDRMILNWRKLKSEDKYPKYDAVMHEFRTKLNLFSEFVGRHELGALKPVTCELTYVNDIPRGQGWEKPAELSNLLADFCWHSSSPRFLSEPRDINLQFVFEIPDSRGSLTFAVGQRTRVSDQISTFVLQLTANGLGPDHSMNAVWSWFENVHVMLNHAFEELTTPSIRELWKQTPSL